MGRRFDEHLPKTAGTRADPEKAADLPLLMAAWVNGRAGRHTLDDARDATGRVQRVRVVLIVIEWGVPNQILRRRRECELEG